MPVTMTVHQTAGLGDDDTDGDGIPDNVEGPGDIDGDGQLNYADLDSDGDSLLDADEFHEDPEWDDLDGDGLLNCYDTDSDGDGLADDYETATGTDPYDPNDPPATPIHLKTIALILLLFSALLCLRRTRRRSTPLTRPHTNTSHSPRPRPAGQAWRPRNTYNIDGIQNPMVGYSAWVGHGLRGRLAIEDAATGRKGYMVGRLPVPGTLPHGHAVSGHFGQGGRPRARPRGHLPVRTNVAHTPTTLVLQAQRRRD